MLFSDPSITVPARAEILFRQHRQRIHERTDRLFVGLLLVEWMGAILAAYLIAPLTWAGSSSQTHLHVWAAIYLGGAITLFPAILGVARSGQVSTRHTIAVSQMLMGGLLIHVTGGRIETHFHIFGSLAFLAFYRDWKIFVPATLVVAADHFLRGLYWPESVYGVTAAPWRWLEHSCWVLFEDVFLVNSCLHSVREMRGIAQQQAQLEQANEQTERTARARTAELRASEEVFRSLSAASPTGIFQTDARGHVTYVNARWMEIVERPSEDCLGERWVQTVHPEDLNTVLLDRSAALRECRETAVEFRAVTPAGTVRWVHLRTKPMLATDGTSVGQVGTLEDISERKNAEVAREAEARTSAALARVGRELISSLETPVLLERVGQLTASALGAHYSNTWLRHKEEDHYRLIAGHGLSSDEWESLQTLRFDANAFPALIERLAQGQIVQLQPEQVSHPILSAVLARHDAKLVACIPLFQNDELIGLQIAGYRDASTAFTHERTRIAHGIGQLASMALTNARLVEEIADASRLKSEFLSTMSHELRTPLNVILGYTDMLADDPAVDDRTLLLGHVRRASLGLLEMITATLDLSKVAAGKDEPRLETVILRELWVGLSTEFAAVHRGGDVTLRWVDPGDIAVHTDRRKLSTIVKNLVGNALKFTAAGEITVDAAVCDGICTLSIRDTGIGVAPETLPFIFDMFRQADSSDSRSYGGVGLGLYIVRNLLTQLGGEIEVESRVGQGSVFRLRLPAATDDAEAVAERVPQVG